MGNKSKIYAVCSGSESYFNVICYFDDEVDATIAVGDTYRYEESFNAYVENGIDIDGALWTRSHPLNVIVQDGEVTQLSNNYFVTEIPGARTISKRNEY
jgi:hypothetical protein